MSSNYMIELTDKILNLSPLYDVLANNAGRIEWKDHKRYLLYHIQDIENLPDELSEAIDAFSETFGVVLKEIPLNFFNEQPSMDI